MKEDIIFKEFILDFCKKRSVEVCLNAEEKAFLLNSAESAYEKVINNKKSLSLFEAMLLSDVWYFLSGDLRIHYRSNVLRSIHITMSHVMEYSEMKQCLRFGFEFADAADYDYYDWDSYWTYERKDSETEEYYWLSYEVKEYKGAVKTPIY